MQVWDQTSSWTIYFFFNDNLDQPKFKWEKPLMNTALPCLEIWGVQLMGQPAPAEILPFTAMTGEKVGVAPK